MGYQYHECQIKYSTFLVCVLEMPQYKLIWEYKALMWNLFYQYLKPACQKFACHIGQTLIIVLNIVSSSQNSKQTCLRLAWLKEDIYYTLRTGPCMLLQ